MTTITIEAFLRPSGISAAPGLWQPHVLTFKSMQDIIGIQRARDGRGPADVSSAKLEWVLADTTGSPDADTVLDMTDLYTGMSPDGPRIGVARISLLDWSAGALSGTAPVIEFYGAATVLIAPFGDTDLAMAFRNAPVVTLGSDYAAEGHSISATPLPLSDIAQDQPAYGGLRFSQDDVFDFGPGGADQNRALSTGYVANGGADRVTASVEAPIYTAQDARFAVTHLDLSRGFAEKRFTDGTVLRDDLFGFLHASVTGTADTLLIGDGGNNRLRSDAGRDSLRGGDGQDQLHGGANADRLFGDAGNDDLHGEDGADRLLGGAGDDTLRGGNDDDRLFGQDGADSLHGDKGHDRLDGKDGDDRLMGGLGNDLMRGGSGDDLLLGDWGTDRMLGGAGDDRLFGDEEGDALYGNRGHDVLNGGQGIDKLYGGSGRDQLNGGKGNDFLFGGSGADVFLFEPTDYFGRDRVKDWEDGRDLLDLSAFGFADFEAVQGLATDTPNGLRLNLGTDSLGAQMQVFVEGLTWAAFDAGDVILA